MNILFILLGLTLLVVGGEFLVRASVALSFKLNISKLVIGLTVVSFATSAPELLVSLNAALKGASDIALGNVIGSNIANIGLVLGITAIISSLTIDKDFFKLNWPVMFLMSLALYFVLKNDKVISRMEGIGLLLVLIVYLVILIRQAKNKKNNPVEEVSLTLTKVSNFKMIVWLLIGGLALYGGSEFLVDGAVNLAQQMGVSERVIAVTMIAVGTSVPELAASVIAAFKQEKAISLGNLIGSNIFNIGCVLGVTSVILPIPVKEQAILTNDIFWMLGFALVFIPLALLPKKFVLNRVKGFLLLVAYAIFTSLAFL